MKVSSFLEAAEKWAMRDENIRCMVLVGSYARGTARDDSDVDLVVTAGNPRLYIRDHSFAGVFGIVDKIETEDWGRVTSIRVFYKDGLEVEFGFTDPSWCSVPLDEGTLRVLTDGYRVMADKDNYFSYIGIKAEKQSDAGRVKKKRSKKVVKQQPEYRSEAEMTELILDVARKDERIRAVVMNGSRTNPDAPKDLYQDYDIVYVVRELDSFLRDHSWIDIFGERVILQMPEAIDLLPPRKDGSFNYQMLFTDGNRIDLNLIPVGKTEELLGKDSLTINMLDKDGILPPAAAPDDRTYRITPPVGKLYDDCCNEFWWVLQNVAKGICRDEMPYAMRMLEYARDMLDQMACWHIGGLNGFKISAGKCGKYFKRYLSERHYKMYTETYSEGRYGKLWKAVFAMCGLFRELAGDVAERSAFVYPERDDLGMTVYLKQMRETWKQSC